MEARAAALEADTWARDAGAAARGCEWQIAVDTAIGDKLEGARPQPTSPLPGVITVGAPPSGDDSPQLGRLS